MIPPLASPLDDEVTVTSEALVLDAEVEVFEAEMVVGAEAEEEDDEADEAEETVPELVMLNCWL
jgi:hypothetical protein